jgi:hypothetical protein
MTTQDKCAAILKEIVRRCNEDGEGPGSGSMVIGFGPDWGGNSLTLFIGDNHTHVGSSDDEYPFDQLIDRLHDQLLEGKGLSFQIPIGGAKA